MNKHILVTITSALVLTCGALGAVAEEGSGFRGRGNAMTWQEGTMDCSMMGHRRMMHRGGMMRRGAAMRFIFALMDGDGDGTVSLQEFQSAQEKIIKAMDTDKDGTITLEEIRAFIRGPDKSVAQEQKYEDEDQDQDQDQEEAD
jgi:hypothetical protein